MNLGSDVNVNHKLFFSAQETGKDFSKIPKNVQEYISSKYSTLIVGCGDEETKAQIKRYINKYLLDYRITAEGMTTPQLVDALYTEMAEFSFLTKYIFGTGIEEINLNSWDDIEVQYANGKSVKLDEKFDSPEHAINVVRRMLHVSGMVLDNASPAVLGHLSKNIRIAVLKAPIVDEDVGVACSIRIVNPQSLKKEDFVNSGTATNDATLLDLVTEAFPIIVFTKQLEDKKRKLMEIMECEIAPDGERIYISGGFLLLRLNIFEFTDSIFKALTTKPKSIKAEINEYTQRKKPSYLRRELMEVQDILAMTGKSNRFSLICVSALGLMTAGSALATMIGNVFLIPVLGIGLMFLPFWYIKLTASHFRKAIAAELETALSIITTAYLRSEDILTAVKENVHYLNPPVQTVFSNFLAQVEHVGPNIDSAIKAMRSKIDNDVFKEWCDALAACQHDRSLKTTLTPITSKLSDIRIVNAELDYLVTAPRKEFISMAILLIGIIPLMFFLNKDWFNTLMFTTIGQVIIAACGGAIFASTAFVIKLTKPIEFKR